MSQYNFFLSSSNSKYKKVCVLCICVNWLLEEMKPCGHYSGECVNLLFWRGQTSEFHQGTCLSPHSGPNNEEHSSFSLFYDRDAPSPRPLWAFLVLRPFSHPVPPFCGLQLLAGPQFGSSFEGIPSVFGIELMNVVNGALKLGSSLSFFFFRHSKTCVSSSSSSDVP